MKPTQTSFLDGSDLLAPTNGSDTSREAARPPRKTQPTSIEAYHTKDEGKAERDRREIMRVIVEAGDVGITDLEISKRTELPINIVTGRRNDLLKCGHIRDGGKNKPVRGSILWKVV